MGKNDEDQGSGVSRRGFMKGAAAGIGGVSLAALAPKEAKALPPPAKWNKTCDIVVAGAGIGGLCAAAMAAQKGRKVILLEASQKSGGTSLFSSGSAGFAKGPTFESMMKFAPYTDPVLGRVVIDNFPPLKKWLREIGVPYVDIPPRMASDADVRVEGYIMLGGKPVPEGPRLFAQGLIDAVKKFGGELITGTKACALFQNPAGDVVGIKSAGKNETIRIGAKAVILGTGGFQNNKELLTRYISPEADLAAARCVPYNDGSGLYMGVAAGAMLSRGMSTFYGHLVPWPLIIPKDPENYEAVPSGKLQEIMSNLQWISRESVMINLNGERYVDENLGDEWINQMTARQPKARGFVVMDQQIREKFAGKSMATGKERVDVLVEFGAVVEKADTLEGLGDALRKHGMHRSNLLNTVGEFNGAVDKKATADLNIAKTGRVFKIEKPPFYGIPCTAGISHNYGGLAITPKGEVLGIGQIPIRGFYAIPGVAGGIQHTDMWCAMSGNMIMGYVTAQNAAEFAKK